MRARSLAAWCRQQDPASTLQRYQALEESSRLYGFGVETHTEK